MSKKTEQVESGGAETRNCLICGYFCGNGHHSDSWYDLNKLPYTEPQPLTDKKYSELRDNLAYLFNHLEHNGDEVGAKLVEDILQSLNKQ